MTHALNMIPRHDGSFLRAVADRLMAFYAEVQKELDRRRRADEIYTQLASRSDRALADLGLSRQDLERIASEAAGSR